MSEIILEICADSVGSALIAQRAGARRVELCADLAHGGITPSYGIVITARRLLNLDLFVLLRPRPGNFVYDDVEFETLLQDVRLCGELGCNGIVTGVLHADGTVDVGRSAELARLARAYSMGTTFHRAFDCCPDLPQALERVIEAGYDRVLTSGGRPTAEQGTAVLAELVKQAGDRIVIMPGSGVNTGNIRVIADRTGAREFHGSFRSPAGNSPDGTMLAAITGSGEELMTDEAKIRQAIEYLK